MSVTERNESRAWGEEMPWMIDSVYGLDLEPKKRKRTKAAATTSVRDRFPGGIMRGSIAQKRGPLSNCEIGGNPWAY